MFAFLREGELGHKRLLNVGNLSGYISELSRDYCALVTLERLEDFLMIPIYGLRKSVSSYGG